MHAREWRGAITLKCRNPCANSPNARAAATRVRQSQQTRIVPHTPLILEQYLHDFFFMFVARAERFTYEPCTANSQVEVLTLINFPN